MSMEDLKPIGGHRWVPSSRGPSGVDPCQWCGVGRSRFNELGQCDKAPTPTRFQRFVAWCRWVVLSHRHPPLLRFVFEVLWLYLRLNLLARDYDRARFTVIDFGFSWRLWPILHITWSRERRTGSSTTYLQVVWLDRYRQLLPRRPR